MKKAVSNKWYNERLWAALLSIASLLAAYGVASRAINTGSLQQYFVAIVLIVFAVNRLVRAIAGPKRAAA